MSPMGVAVVSGASRGLGASIARRLAADGWPVAVNYRRGRAQAESVVETSGEAGGVAERSEPTSSTSGVSTDLFEEVGQRARTGHCGRRQRHRSAAEVALEELTWRTHLDQLEFFVKSPTLLVQAALPSMRALAVVGSS